MIPPFIENPYKIFQYVFLWIIYALLQTFVLSWIIPVSFGELLVDGFIHAIIFGLLCILLWSVVKYGNYAVLPIYQRIVNYSGLAFIVLTVWIGGGYGIAFLIFGKENAFRFIPALPVLGLTGLLIFLLIIQYFRFMMTDSAQNETVTEDLSPEPKPAPANEKEILERIAVKLGQKIHVVSVTEIMYFLADGDYVDIFTAEGKFLKEQTMKYFEEHLPANQFVRIHRSCIVNVEEISRIELYEKQSQLLTLKNGEKLRVSPTGYKTLRSVLNL